MIRIAMQAVRAAAAVIDAAEPSLRSNVSMKGEVDPVTATDLACEAAIREILDRETPGIPILAEEGGGARDAATCWIVDPLDGTVNYLHGYPHYAVCVALQVEGRIILGCVWDAVRHRMFWATAGGGAFRDGTKIHVSATASLEKALVSTGFPYDRRQRADEYLRYVRAFMVRSQAFRRSGSAAIDLVTVAEGGVDAWWEFKLQPWDVAAGSLIVQEAGGCVTNSDGTTLDIHAGHIVASNGLLHDEVLDVLRLVRVGGT